MRRADSQSSSCHSYVERKTTDAVFGGTSAAKANGSAFRRRWPSAPTTSNLYFAPSAASGTSACQIPDEPAGSSGSALPSQRFQSPTTATFWALGAQTANETPPSTRCAPSCS